MTQYGFKAQKKYIIISVITLERLIQDDIFVVKPLVATACKHKSPTERLPGAQLKPELCLSCCMLSEYVCVNVRVCVCVNVYVLVPDFDCTHIWNAEGNLCTQAE